MKYNLTTKYEFPEAIAIEISKISENAGPSIN
jgi:hypothetical protein